MLNYPLTRAVVTQTSPLLIGNEIFGKLKIAALEVHKYVELVDTIYYYSSHYNVRYFRCVKIHLLCVLCTSSRNLVNHPGFEASYPSKQQDVFKLSNRMSLF